MRSRTFATASPERIGKHAAAVPTPEPMQYADRIYRPRGKLHHRRAPATLHRPGLVFHPVFDLVRLLADHHFFGRK